MSAHEYPVPYPVSPTPANQESFGGIRRAFGNNRNIARALAVTGAACSLLDGTGAIDGAVDPFQEAGDVVVAAQNQYGAGYADDRFGEAGALAAVGRVTRTMSDLDGQEYAAIRTRAAVFQEANAADILQPDDRAAYETAVSQAESAEAVVGHVDNFMGFYGKDAELLTEDLRYVGKYQDVPLEVVQDAGLDIIDALAPLPRPVVYESDFQVLAIGGADEDGYMAQYHSTKGIALELDSNPEEGQGDRTVQSAILHEIGHGNHSHSVVRAGSEVSGMQRIDQAVSDFVGRPSAVSEYAHTNESERRAEAFWWAHDTGLGPIHPDEALRYGSPANKQVLAELLFTEQIVPGATDYLVSLNPDLMQDPGIYPDE